MRKLLAILLLLCLLTACGTTTTPTEPPTATPTQAPTATPTKTTPSFTLPETATLPPRETLPPVERYTAEPRYSFVPADDYGAVYPFFDRIYSNWMFDEAQICGFVDAQGRIVCDACFDGVALLTRGDNRVYIGYSNIKDANKYGELIAFDGSWRYQTITSYYLDETWVTLPAFNGDKWGAIDWQGQVVVPFAYDAPVYSDGQTITVAERVEHLVTVHYVDLQTGKSIGPFTRRYGWLDGRYYSLLDYTFYNDRALFIGENGLYGYIDRTGEVVVEPKFQEARNFEGDYAQVHLDEGLEHLQFYYIDTEGNLIKDDPYEPSRYSVYGITCEDGLFYNTLTQEPIALDGDVTAHSSYHISSDAIFVFHDNSIQRFNHSGKLQALYTLPSDSYYESEFIERNGSTFIAVACYKNEVRSYVLLDDHCTVVATSRSKPEIYGDYILVYNGATAGLVDLNGQWLFRTTVSIMGR